MPREKEFEPDVALADAMDLFWEQGYEATSVQDLVDRMGINRFSMYDTFGNKHDLFIKALERYRKETTSGPIGELKNSPEGLNAIRDYFSTMVDHLSGPGGKKSCLMVNSLAEKAACDDEISTCVMENVTCLENAFRRAIERAQALGEIKSDRSPDRLAEFLVTNAFGISVLGKGPINRSRLESTVDTVMEALE
ncbi:MAG: TetR/AcrR family transcriptional regulator [Gemmatimonadota bacterium]